MNQKANKPRNNPYKKRARRLPNGAKMPVFWPQHHEELAKVMGGQKPFGDMRAELAWDKQVRALATYLKDDNSRFDTKKFFRLAGGLPTDKEGKGE